MDNLLKKNNFLMTCVQEDSSKDALSPNMLPSFWSSLPWPTDVHVSIVGFRVSKHFLKRKITTFKSYFVANRIEFPHPTKFPWFIMIWIKNLTLWQTCYGFGLYLRNLKTREKVLKPLQLLPTWFFGEEDFGIKSIGPKFLSHLKPTPF